MENVVKLLAVMVVGAVKQKQNNSKNSRKRSKKSQKL